MTGFANLATASAASSLALWRGTLVVKAAVQPPKALILYDCEASPECRAVREALTALHLDALVRPCPIGGKRSAAQLAKSSSGATVPVLDDRNLGQVYSEPRAIIAHLFEHYGQIAVPAMYRALPGQGLLGKAASALRLGRGSRARPSRRPKQPLALWSFESSPYSRPVREVLSELELPYHLHNLGKEHWDELGPAVRRLRPGPYVPSAGGKRHAFWQQHGRVQVPYLEDPNTQTAMFESAQIVDYLEREYAL